MRTLIGCCLIHLCIGSIYAFSVLYSKFIAVTGWDNSVLITGFSLSILTLGLTAATHQRIFSGKYTKVVLSYGLLFWLTGMVMLWLNLCKEWDSPVVHYLSSIILGTGVGLLYVIPINLITATSNKAIASGSVVTCFGLGSILSAQVFSQINFIPSLLTLTGILLYALLIIVGILLIKDNSMIESQADFKPDTRWKILFIMFFLNIGIGISLLSNLTNLSVYEHGWTLDEAVLLVSVAGVANTLGRFIYPAMLDKEDRFFTLNFMVDSQALLLIMMAVSNFMEFGTGFYWSIGVIVIILAYGGMFAVMPSIMNQMYGNPTAYSRALVAWGAAGVVCPMLFNIVGFSILLIMGSLLAYLSVELDEH